MIREFIINLSGNDYREVNTAKGTEIQIRCPICGDSKKDRKRKRFYYNLKKNSFFCFNCQCKGGIKQLIDKFPNVSNVNYDELEKYIANQQIEDFIYSKENIYSVKKQKYELFYPDGSVLDYLLESKEYQHLEEDDKTNLLKVVKYLRKREVTQEWYRYFYFPFSSEKFENYILTLFEWNGEWIWSGRKVWGQGSKYKHLQDYPFHEALGFANEISTEKGKELYITEGWFDALILNQEGYNAVCVFGLQNMKYNHKPLNKFRKDYNLVWIPDNDSSLKDFLKLNEKYEELTYIMLLDFYDINDMKIACKDKFEFNFKICNVWNIREVKNIIDTKIIF